MAEARTTTFEELVEFLFEGRGQEQDSAHACTEGRCIIHAQYIDGQLYIGRSFYRENTLFFRSVSSEARTIAVLDLSQNRWFANSRHVPATATNW